MNQALLTKYAAELKALKELTAEVKKLGDAVLAELQAEKLDKMQMPEGTFSVVKRKSYEFPDVVIHEEEAVDAEIAKLSERVEAAREAAIAAGTAKLTETETLRFQAAKV